MTMSRKLWAALLLLAAVPVGFALGAWIGARFLIPANAGLAGGAMVFWYGLLGFVLAQVAAIVAIRALAPSRLKPVALVGAGLAMVLLVLAGVGVSNQQEERSAQRQHTLAMLPPFELVLVGRVGDSIERVSYASEANQLQVELENGLQCLGGLPPGKAGDRSRVELLSALRGLDVAGMFVDPPACQQAGEVLATLDARIREAKPPVTAGRLRLTQVCRDEIPQVDALFEQVRMVYRRHKRELDCR